MKRSRNPLQLKRKNPFRGFWAGPVRTQEEAEKPMAEILIFDVIGEDFFGEGITGLTVREALSEVGDQDVRVRINSPGGDVFDGVAIHNALREHKGRVQVVIDALAASAASIIAMAGDEIIMVENATLMIHEPWTFALGDATELRAQADILETINEGLVITYARRTGQSREEIAALLRAETWLSAEEALEGGFVDEVVEAGDVREGFKAILAKIKKPAARDRSDVEAFVGLEIITGGEGGFLVPKKNSEVLAEGFYEEPPEEPGTTDPGEDVDTAEKLKAELSVEELSTAAAARTNRARYKVRILSLDKPADG